MGGDFAENWTTKMGTTRRYTLCVADTSSGTHYWPAKHLTHQITQNIILRIKYAFYIKCIFVMPTMCLEIMKNSDNAVVLSATWRATGLMHNIILSLNRWITWLIYKFFYPFTGQILDWNYIVWYVNWRTTE